jgi:hypothetical protein
MKPLSAVLPQILNTTLSPTNTDGFKPGLNTQIWRVWNRVVGDHIAHRAQPDHLRGSLLYIEVKASNWLPPLQEIGPQLLEKLNGAISHKISRLVFFHKQQGFGSTKNTKKTEVKDEEPRWYDQLSLNSNENEKIKQELHQISDTELREIVGRVWIKAAKLEKLRR